MEGRIHLLRILPERQRAVVQPGGGQICKQEAQEGEHGVAEAWPIADGGSNGRNITEPGHIWCR